MKRGILFIVALVVLGAGVSASVKTTQEPKHAPLPAVAQPQAAGEQAAPPADEVKPAGEGQPAEAKAEGQEGHAAGAGEHAAAGAEHGGGEHGGESPWATVARLFNFALLAGTLIYLLRSPFGAFLEGRQAQIRKSLADAAATREDAAQQLAHIDQKLAALPADLEDLRRRGSADIAAEEDRIREAAEIERQRMVEHGKREIERHGHLAERQLVERAGSLAVNVATERVKRTITSADQERLVDRYLEQVRPETIGS